MKWYNYLPHDPEWLYVGNQEVYIKLDETEEDFIRTLIKQPIDSHPDINLYLKDISIQSTYRWFGGKGYVIGSKLEKVDGVFTITAKVETPLLDLLEAICKWWNFPFEYEVIEGLNPDRYFTNYLLEDKSKWSAYL